MHDLRDWNNAETMRAALNAQREVDAVRMCHAQGKTAVYLSDEGDIAHHSPDRTITRRPLHSGR